jgi:hypothetical protein
MRLPCPIGFVSIAKPIEVFVDGDWSRIVNLVQDFRKSIVIQAGQKYLAHYRIKTSPPFFSEGITDFHMAYRIAYEKEFNKRICGRLKSNMVQVLVKKAKL